jgi:CRP/FNR family cyclic AMP-dependent transcriptional regulator
MLPESTREELLGLGTLREYAADSVLMMEGDRTYEVMALIDGWVKIVGETREGGHALLALRVGGDLVGEQAAIENQPRSATAISAGVTVVQVIGQSDFLRFLGSRPEASMAVSRALSAKLRWSTRRRIDFSGLPVLVRLARVLSELAQLDGRPVREGFEFGYTLTQPELAAMVGASEPSVHKALRQLREDGIVVTGYRKVIVTDPRGLTAVAGSGWTDDPLAQG